MPEPASRRPAHRRGQEQSAHRREVDIVTMREFVVPVTALLLGACASTPTPVTRSPKSPAHPAAAEAVTPPAAPVLMSGDDDAAAPPAPGSPEIDMDMHESSAAVYSCPMHPAVKADKPGSCPVCGMTLVKEKPARPEGGGSR